MTRHWQAAAAAPASHDVPARPLAAVASLTITFVDSDARTGDTGDAPRSRDASVDMAK
jgi:hypothetical protein